MNNPPIYFYRDKNGKEIDIVIEQNGTVYPIEIKKAATVRSDWNKNFDVFDKLNIERGEGVVISLSDDILRLSDKDRVVPAWLIS